MKNTHSKLKEEKDNKKKKKETGFTLVELIVVITILAILATIAFISFTGYSQNSRDSKRIADINSIQKSLELYITEKGTYPIPDNNASITYSGAIAWIEGTVGDGVMINMENINKKPLDPLTENEYTYSITSAKTEYQIGAVTEGGTIGYKLPITQTHAATEKKATAMIRGTYNERFLRVQSGTLNWILAIPSIIATDITQTDVQTILTNNKLVYNNYQNIPHSYNNAGYTMTGGFNYTNSNPLIYSGSLKNLAESNTGKLTFITNLKAAYNGTILQGEANYKDIVNADPSNQTGSIYLVNRFINTNLGGIKVSNIILPTGGGTTTETTQVTGENVLLMHGEDNMGIGHIGNYVQFSQDGHLTTPSNTAFDFSGGNYTIEMRFKGSNLNNVLLGRWDDTGNGRWGLYFIEAGKLAFLNNSSGWQTVKSGISTTDWHHFVWTYNGTTNSFYIDGVLSFTYNSSITTTNSSLAVGGLASVMFSNLGVDELRMYKGKQFTLTEVTDSYNRGLSGLASNITDNLVAYYPFDTDFNDTVGTKHLTKVAGTAISITGGPAAFIDSAKSSSVIPYGNAVIDTSTKKFGVSSMKFDGAGDYLQVADSSDLDFGTGDFTIDFWINPSNSANDNIIISDRIGSSINDSWMLQLYNHKLYVAVRSGGSMVLPLSGVTTINDSTWYHVALVRNLSTFTVYVNGSVDSSGTAVTFDNYEHFEIGGLSAVGNYYSGHIDEIRVSKGIAQWTNTFTPPISSY